MEAIVKYFEVISLCFSGEFEDPPCPTKNLNQNSWSPYLNLSPQISLNVWVLHTLSRT